MVKKVLSLLKQKPDVKRLKIEKWKRVYHSGYKPTFKMTQIPEEKYNNAKHICSLNMKEMTKTSRAYYEVSFRTNLARPDKMASAYQPPPEVKENKLSD
jgi:hypothetical protein